MLGPYSFNYGQCAAAEQFGSLHRQALQHKFWARLTGRRIALQNLAEIQTENQVKARNYCGLQLVPMAQICGSESRCADFDTAFRPLQNHTRARWISVAVAREQDVALPPVELVQVKGRYFVRDGHHRISVARMLGQLEIEAEVTVWHCAPQSDKQGGKASQPAAVAVTVQRPGIADHLLGRLGGWLVTLGTKLQARASSTPNAPAMQGNPA